MGLGDFLRAYNEGAALKAFGPGWREKIAQQRAQTGLTEAETAGTQAGTELKGLQADEIRKALADATRKRDALIAAGIDPDTAHEVAQKALNDSLVALHGAQAEHARAGAALETAQATQPERFHPRQPQVTPLQVITPAGPAVFNAPKISGTTVPLPTGANFRTDVAAARTAMAGASTIGGLLPHAERSAAALAEHLSNPAKALTSPLETTKALRDYHSDLQALAVPFGRLLGDTRISEQDRTAYARAIGEPSTFFNIMDPKRALTRLQVARGIYNDAARKYGSKVPELFQEAGAAPEAPGAAPGTDLPPLPPGWKFAGQ